MSRNKRAAAAEVASVCGTGFDWNAAEQMHRHLEAGRRQLSADLAAATNKRHAHTLRTQLAQLDERIASVRQRQNNMLHGAHLRLRARHIEAQDAAMRVHPSHVLNTVAPAGQDAATAAVVSVVSAPENSGRTTTWMRDTANRMANMPTHSRAAAAARDDVTVAHARIRALQDTLCSHCGTARVDNGTTSYMECPQCGMREYHEEMGSKAFPKSGTAGALGPDHIAPSNYRRDTHLHQMVMSRMTPATPEELDEFRVRMKQLGFTAKDAKDWTLEFVSDLVVAWGRPKLKKKAVSLLFGARNEPVPQMTKAETQFVQHVFAVSEATFMERRHEMQRSNFSYRPTMRNIMILLGLDHMVELFPTLKTPGKRQDASGNFLSVIARANGWEEFDESVISNFRPPAK